MAHKTKNHVQPESTEEEKLQKSSTQEQENAAPDMTNMSHEQLQHMSTSDIMALQRTIGNRAVTRLLARRAGEEEEEDAFQRAEEEEEDEEAYPGPRSSRDGDSELDYPGPRSSREEKSELDYPGPRTKSPGENGSGQRNGSGRSSSSSGRAAPHSSATGDIGDAFDVDGEGMYGWDRVITWRDVKRVVDGVRPTVSSDEEMPRIVIFSGTHGNRRGHLVNDARSRGFVAEDQATANAVMREDPSLQVEVIDVVTSYATKAELTAIYGMTDFIRVLGWCYSKRSYNLGSRIKSNWWAAPDRL